MCSLFSFRSFFPRSGTLISTRRPIDQWWISHDECMHKLLKALATNETAADHGKNALFKVHDSHNSIKLEDDSFDPTSEEHFLRRPSTLPPEALF